MSAPVAALTCSDNPIGRVCSLLQDRSFPGADVFGVILQDLLQGLLVFLVVVLAGRFLRGVTLRGLARTTADAQLRTLIHNVFTFATLTVAVLAGLTAGGLNISIVLTFGGLTSLAIGLAFQDLLRNVLAGVFLLVERPFRIGDWIVVGDQAGWVQTIQLRTTALRTVDGRLAILPNLVAFSGTVINATAYDMRQYTVEVHLPAGFDLAGAIAAIRQILDSTAEVVKEPRPFIQPRLEEDGKVTLKCRYWVEYRSHDPDTLSAALVQRFYEALKPWPEPDAVPSARKPPARPSPASDAL
jgi:small conductance mechanosensitive channel